MYPHHESEKDDAIKCQLSGLFDRMIHLVATTRSLCALYSYRIYSFSDAVVLLLAALLAVYHHRTDLSCPDVMIGARYKNRLLVCVSDFRMGNKRPNKLCV